MALIEREALLKEREKAIEVYENANIFSAHTIREGLKPLLDVIVDTPAIDAAPVVHGRWIEYMPFLGAGNLQTHCSACGLTNDVRTPYCPNCGARMGGEGDG